MHNLVVCFACIWKESIDKRPSLHRHQEQYTDYQVYKVLQHGLRYLYFPKRYIVPNVNGVSRE